jgi:hypothetical protein
MLAGCSVEKSGEVFSGEGIIYMLYRSFCIEKMHVSIILLVFIIYCIYLVLS